VADDLDPDDGDRYRHAAAEPDEGREELSQDTIWAWATPPGRSALAVLRISGPAVGNVLHALGVRVLPAPRRASLARLVDPADGQPIDQAIVLRFPAPASFTGEDLVEIQHHGGLGVRRMLANVLAHMPSLRPAEAGEFTRRAFLAGKLGLSEVAGLGDLVDATTARAARHALLRLEGEVSRQVEAWSDQLLGLRAEIEADLDFAADQADVTAGALGRAGPRLELLRDQLRKAVQSAGAATRLREGFVVAVTGRPNVGKSSLVNLLAGREVAIVTERPGTTRDPIEVELDLNGLPVTLIDTAGLRETDDPIEQEGIRRAREKAAGADLVIELVDARDMPPAVVDCPNHLIVVNKADLVPDRWAMLAISCRTGTGIDELLAAIAARLDKDLPAELGAVPADARGQAAVSQALEAVEQALAALPLAEPVLVAEELRAAALALARLTGLGGDPEDVLSAIFARFCIGK
jgi:tRNA modification GTPase